MVVLRAAWTLWRHAWWRVADGRADWLAMARARGLEVASRCCCCCRLARASASSATVCASSASSTQHRCRCRVSNRAKCKEQESVAIFQRARASELVCPSTCSGGVHHGQVDGVLERSDGCIELHALNSLPPGVASFRVQGSEISTQYMRVLEEQQTPSSRALRSWRWDRQEAETSLKSLAESSTSLWSIKYERENAIRERFGATTSAGWRAALLSHMGAPLGQQRLQMLARDGISSTARSRAVVVLQLLLQLAR